MCSLEDLDITVQPGAPGADSARAGGIRPVFRLSRTADSTTRTVMSGAQVATQMTAHVVPIDAGHSRVIAKVRRGDAPDDFVFPAFRSKGITLSLFSMALDGELDKLTRPATTSLAAPN